MGSAERKSTYFKSLPTRPAVETGLAPKQPTLETTDVATLARESKISGIVSMPNASRAETTLDHFVMVRIPCDRGERNLPQTASSLRHGFSSIGFACPSWPLEPPSP